MWQVKARNFSSQLKFWSTVHAWGNDISATMFSSVWTWAKGPHTVSINTLQQNCWNFCPKRWRGAHVARSLLASHHLWVWALTQAATSLHTLVHGQPQQEHTACSTLRREKSLVTIYPLFFSNRTYINMFWFQDRLDLMHQTLLCRLQWACEPAVLALQCVWSSRLPAPLRAAMPRPANASTRTSSTDCPI